MPSPLSSALLIFGLIFAVLALSTPAIVFGALGVGWELVLLYLAGQTG